MGKYIALLRGINVGGKNKISMVELKELFRQHGFEDVQTYINSGNVIFSSSITDEKIIKEECEEIITKKFKLNIPVLVISFKEFFTTFNNAPTWWDQDENSKHNAIFIMTSTTMEEVFNEVGEIKPDYEKVGYYGRVIFWSAPIETFSKTRWSKVVSSSLYNIITIRNANTVKKILQLAK